MRGTLLIIPPAGAVKTRTLYEPPDLEALQDELGGYLEQVPHLTTIDYRGTVYRCVALCDEDGRDKHLPFNAPADRLWTAAIARMAAPDRAAAVDPNGILVGVVVVIFGDQELMAAL